MSVQGGGSPVWRGHPQQSGLSLTPPPTYCTVLHGSRASSALAITISPSVKQESLLMYPLG